MNNRIVGMCFLEGKYTGRSLDEIAKIDKEYIDNLLSLKETDDIDRIWLQTSLEYANKTEEPLLDDNDIPF